MPSYVQDIIYMEFQDIYTVRPKVPFVLINTNGSIVNIFVGTNLALGRRSTNGDIRIVSITNQVAYENNACYFASYAINSDGTFSIRTPWSVRVGTDWGNTGYVVYNSSSITSAATSDFYLFGGNMIKGDDGSFKLSVNVPLNTGSSSDQVVVYQRPLGFIEGVYFPYQDEVPMYFKDFDIPTKEQLEEQTQKGIWATLKSIPEMIAEKFKGLFIPEEGYFDTYTEEFQSYFRDRLGLLYELPDSVIDIFQQLVDYKPAEDGYSIHIPEVKFPVLDNGNWYDKVLIPEQDYTFDFLNQGGFATLYSLYRSVLWLTFIFLLINLIIRKANKVLGGDSG